MSARDDDYEWQSNLAAQAARSSRMLWTGIALVVLWAFMGFPGAVAINHAYAVFISNLHSSTNYTSGY